MTMDEPTSRLIHALAAELRDTCGQVEQLAATLALDEDMLDRFLVHLQSFDLIAQQVGESAELLGRVGAGSAADAAVSHVRLERMQQRLRRELDRDPQRRAA